MRVAVIGAGAAGFFASFSVKEHYPNAQVEIFEKTDKALSKVKVSGGGRCNVTHNCLKVAELVNYYPRGGKKLKKVFSQFNVNHTLAWFKDKKVELKTESDGRMFPVSDSSMTIIGCFLDEVRRLGIKIHYKSGVEEILPQTEGFTLKVNGEALQYDKVIVTTGGSPKLSGFQWLEKLNQLIVPPVPSLFTFNIPNTTLHKYLGISIPKGIVKIPGTDFQYDGPMLITHWGLSGPAVLKTSAFGARYLADKNYAFETLINWTGISNEEEVRKLLYRHFMNYSKKQVQNIPSFDIPSRLWSYFIAKAGFQGTEIAGEVSKSAKNTLINTLVNDSYQVKGKTTFKEEFVTCGGVDLDGVNLKTMQSKFIPGLYFAGEVLDIDGVTGGFNFQSAWSTAHVAGRLKD
jgi:hypothetical protein